MSVPAHQLRAWAQGDYPTEAAVEMLIRAHGGRFARTSCPWINHVRNSTQMCRVDWDRLHHESGTFSGGQRRFLNIAISLGSPDHPVDLSNNIAGWTWNCSSSSWPGSLTPPAPTTGRS